ncbi:MULTISPECIES: HPP family protein [unclassified Knoellia]|uniref:CBS domain-containing protein n=1 Tax=Knoellia altitudinis TaxID=3404795 RepID=UPI00361B3247
MLVADIMTTPARSIRPEATLAQAIALLGGAGLSALPVVDRDDRVVGIISEGDVLRQTLPQDPRAHLRLTPAASREEPLVGELMTADASCATAREDASEVALTLSRRGWKSMPVTDEEGRLLGMVSRSDFLRALALTDEVLVDAVHDAFTQAGHPEWHADVHGGHVTVSPPGDGMDTAAKAIAATVAGVRSVRVGQDG